MNIVKKRNPRPVATAILLATAALGMALFITQARQANLAMDPNATIGIPPGFDVNARRDQLQRELDDSQIAFSINTSPAFDSGAAQGNLLLENPANNNKLITAQIVLDETGETLYESGALAPGTYLERISLKKPLGKGTYPATVYLKAFRMDTQELIGQTGAAITLQVLA